MNLIFGYHTIILIPLLLLYDLEIAKPTSSFINRNNVTKSSVVFENRRGAKQTYIKGKPSPCQNKRRRVQEKTPTLSKDKPHPLPKQT